MNLNDSDLNRVIRVMIVDDHPLVRDSLKMHLQKHSDIDIIGEAGDGEEAVNLAQKLLPDVIVMDISMPKMNGLESTRLIKAQWPNIEILVLTVHDDTEHVLKILEAGASGYLTKKILGDKLIHAIRAVISGESVISDDVKNSLLIHALRYPQKSAPSFVREKLSPRELEIFRLAAKGMSNKEISQKLDLNLRTVKGHLGNIFSKLNVCSRTEALVTGLRTGLINMDDIYKSGSNKSKDPSNQIVLS